MIRRVFLAVVALALVFPSMAFLAQESASLRVAVYDDKGVSKGVENVVKVLAKHSGLSVKRVKAADIRSGILDEFDVLIHPGGSGSKQGKELGEAGREQVRAFVRKGGGFIGICAGAYLATRDYSWSLHILDAKVIDKAHWARGYGDVALQMTGKGQELLGVKGEKITIYYHQGPLLAPGADPEIPDYEPLAIYEGEIAKNGAPKGVMPGTTAIAVGTFGKGRVLCFSPHPERTEGMQDMVHRGVLWVAGK